MNKDDSKWVFTAPTSKSKGICMRICDVTDKIKIFLISTDLPLSVASPLVSFQSGQLHGSSGRASRQDRSGD
jgi:hypothetical protein